jgi:hypothetical protein
MKKKNVYRFLKREAEKLPKKEYQCVAKYDKPRLENVAAESEEASLQWVEGELFTREVSHYDRLKTVYNRGGMPAVSEYFLKQGFYLVNNEE